MKVYRPTGQLSGLADLITPLTKEGAQVHLYHHVSISETLVTVVAAGLGLWILSSVLKYKGSRKTS